MPRHTKIVNLSLPFDVYENVDELAQQRGISKSELLRDALKHYVVAEKRWRQIYRWGEESARLLDIRDEADVDRLIHQFRREQAQH